MNAEVPAAGLALDWTIVTFLGYTIAVFLLAGLSHRLLRGRGFLKEYFLGSRGLGVWALAMTYAATSASGGSFTGFPAKIYQHGWVLALWIASYMVVPVVCLGLLGKRLNQVARRSGAITLPDVLRDRYSEPGLGLLISVILAFFLAFNLVAQFKAGGVIIDVLLRDVGLYQDVAESMSWIRSLSFLGDGAPSASYCLALVLFAGGVIVYTAYGGFRAVVWTDVLQGVVMFAGVIALLPLALWKAGGLESATRHVAAIETDRIGAIELVARAAAGTEGELWPRGARVVITRDGVRHEFETVGALTAREVLAAGGELAATRGIRAVAPGAVPPEPWSGPGAEVSVESAPPGAIDVRRYEIAPRRSLVTAPGPAGTSFHGFLPIGLAISYFVMWAITGAGQPGTLVRMMAFKSTQVYRKSIFVVTFYYSLIYIPLVLIFICARKIIPSLSDPDQAMAVTVTTVAPAVLAGFLLAAPFAAVMSTVDSFLLIISSSLVRDIYQRWINPGASPETIKRASYLTTVLVGIVVTIGALNPPEYLQDIIVFTSAGLASCFLAPMVYSLYWKRATARGIYWAIGGGFVALMGLYIINWVRAGAIAPYNLFGLMPAVWGLVVSFAAGYLGSILGPPPPRDLVRYYFAAGEQGPHPSRRPSG